MSSIQHGPWLGVINNNRHYSKGFEKNQLVIILSAGNGPYGPSAKVVDLFKCYEDADTADIGYVKAHAVNLLHGNGNQVPPSVWIEAGDPLPPSCMPDEEWLNQTVRSCGPSSDRAAAILSSSFFSDMKTHLINTGFFIRDMDAAKQPILFWGVVQKETDKAWLLSVALDYDDWYPKSQVTHVKPLASGKRSQVFEIPRWLLEKKVPQSVVDTFLQHQDAVGAGGAA